MDKMRFETVDGTRHNIDKIAEMFPQVVTEVLGEDGKLKRAVKWDVLKELLSGDYVEGGECYEFTWPGKRAAIAEAAKPIRKTLRPCKEESKNWDTTENLYIEGDNLEVLKLLQESYLGKVKMIYIDPPYNTGNDFVYKDNFTKDKDTSEDELGLFDEETDNRTMSGELFKNTESNGRFHSDWCSMIYPRLQIAKNLLAEDGIIFISINDVEVYNLKNICDEIFGLQNHVATFVWKNKYGPGAFTKGVADLHEYIIAYSKGHLASIEAPLTDEDKAKYKSIDSKFETRGGFITQPLATRSKDDRPNLVYPLVHNGIEIWPNKQWIWEKNRLLKAYENDELVIREDNGKFSVRFKQYLKDENGKTRNGKPLSLVNAAFNQDGTQEVSDLIGRGVFDFPKPTKLIKTFLSFIVNNCTNENIVILDFFSGASTTAHTVMQLNAEDGGKRKFIMVQLPEVCAEKSEAAKAGYKNICEIGKERIRRAGEKIKEEGGVAAANLDIGFRVFKVADSNMKDVYYSAGEYSQDMLDSLVSNIKEDRTDLDLLYGCLLEWGVVLSLPHTSETIDNVTVHTVNNGDLIACFDANIPESAIRTIAKRQPLRAVFRDSSFASAPQKINVEEIFKLLSPTTTVKVI